MAVFPRLASTRRDRVASRVRSALRALAALGATGAFLVLPSAAGALVTEPEATPTISELVLSKSLRNVLRKGLSVRYSVSEPVAGRFELLLATSLARHLHLSGVSATGLAAGTPPETIIGKAILVTTSGGADTLTIQFGAKTVKRLRHMHSVTLIVRLLVHNAHAKTATATATVTLSG